MSAQDTNAGVSSTGHGVAWRSASALLRAAAHAARVAATALVIASVVMLVGLGIGPHTGLYRTVTVLTDSMAPGMPAGSVAVLRPVPSEAVKVGDVITYASPLPGHPIVTHRITAIRVRGVHPVVQTKGDASSAADPWQTQLSQDRTWRRVLVIPLVGWLVHDLRVAVAGVPLVAMLPFALYGLLMVRLWRPAPVSEPNAAT